MIHLHFVPPAAASRAADSPSHRFPRSSRLAFGVMLGSVVGVAAAIIFEAGPLVATGVTAVGFLAGLCVTSVGVSRGHPRAWPVLWACGSMRSNMSINTDTHLQEAASRRMVRAGYLQR